MVLEAAGLARVVFAGLDALLAPFGAHIVRNAQGIFGQVGLLVVTAKAAILERSLGKLCQLIVHFPAFLPCPGNFASAPLRGLARKTYGVASIGKSCAG